MKEPKAWMWWYRCYPWLNYGSTSDKSPGSWDHDYYFYWSVTHIQPLSTWYYAFCTIVNISDVGTWAVYYLYRVKLHRKISMFLGQGFSLISWWNVASWPFTPWSETLRGKVVSMIGWRICWVGIFIPIWGNDSIWLYNILQMGWNHQLVWADINVEPSFFTREMACQVARLFWFS